MLQRIEPEEPSSWPGTRVRAAREAMAVNPGEFATLLGMHYDTLRVWEADGLPQKTGCPVVLYPVDGAKTPAFRPGMKRRGPPPEIFGLGFASDVY